MSLSTIIKKTHRLYIHACFHVRVARSLEDLLQSNAEVEVDQTIKMTELNVKLFLFC